MNESRRTALRDAIAYLDKAISVISTVIHQETYAMDNVPENLQETERFSKMEDGVDAMEEAVENIREAKNSLSEAIT